MRGLLMAEEAASSAMTVSEAEVRVEASEGRRKLPRSSGDGAPRRLCSESREPRLWRGPPEAPEAREVAAGALAAGQRKLS